MVPMNLERAQIEEPMSLERAQIEESMSLERAQIEEPMSLEREQIEELMSLEERAQKAPYTRHDFNNLLLMFCNRYGISRVYKSA